MGGASRIVRRAVKTVAKPVTQVAQAAGIMPKSFSQMGGEELAVVKSKAAVKPKAPAQAAAESVTSSPSVTPKASVAYGGSEMAADSNQTRRRRARGIQTSARGVTGTARTARKTLLGE